MSENIRRRIEDLEAAAPEEVVLFLRGGGQFRHPGPALRFYCEGMDQIRAGRGPLLDAIVRTVSATGCAKLWELLQAVADSPVENSELERRRKCKPSKLARRK
jgi:hypothetical protein